MTELEKSQKRFCLVLIKPSHYDDDGYVIQWLRAPIPSNSLAVIYGLALDCAKRNVLGDDIDIDIQPFDETHTRIRPKHIASMIESAGSGMVMLPNGRTSTREVHALNAITQATTTHVRQNTRVGQVP